MKGTSQKKIDSPSCRRAGVTLTEVLMSLMIMSIGVSLVATLFPIAALRSAQATKMTNGAILKYDLEARIRTQPEFIFDPDGDFLNSSPTSPNYWLRLTEHFRANSEKNYIIDPNGYLGAASNFGLASGTVGPVNYNGATGDVNAVPVNLRGFADYFGNTAAAAGGEYKVLPRYDGGIRSIGIRAGLGLSTTTLRDFELLASRYATLGDGWDVVVDEVAETFIDDSGATVTQLPSTFPWPVIVGVRLSDEIDLSSLVTSRQYSAALTIPDPELTRITLFRDDGRISQSFPLTAVSGQDCVWTEAAIGALPATDYNQDNVISTRGLPIEFIQANPSGPGRVLIETKRVQDFNWLLTVRRGSDGRARGIDVVVMFNNGRSPDDERAYPATFTQGAFSVIANKTSGVNASGDPAEPAIKRGGWVLDVENARWYRMSKIEDFPASPATQYLITLETAADASSPSGGGGAIFIPGIIDVYPLGSLALPESMTPRNF